MKRSFIVLFLATFLVSIVAEGHSQYRKRRHRHIHRTQRNVVEITPYIGGAFLDPQFQDFAGFDEISDAIFGVRIGFLANRNFEVEFNIGDIPASDIIPDEGFFPIDRVNESNILFTDLNFLLNLDAGHDVVTPYVLLGIGRITFFFDDEFFFDDITEGFTSYNIGFGVKAYASRRVAFRGDLRHIRTFLNSDSLNSTQLTGGISVFF